MGQLDESERFEQRRQVHAEATAIALAQPVPAARPDSPRCDPTPRPCRPARASARRPRRAAPSRPAPAATPRGRRRRSGGTSASSTRPGTPARAGRRLVAVHRVRRRARCRGEAPGIVLRAGALCHVSPSFAANSTPPTRWSGPRTMCPTPRRHRRWVGHICDGSRAAHSACCRKRSRRSAVIPGAGFAGPAASCSICARMRSVHVGKCCAASRDALTLPFDLFRDPVRGTACDSGGRCVRLAAACSAICSRCGRPALTRRCPRVPPRCAGRPAVGGDLAGHAAGETGDQNCAHNCGPHTARDAGRGLVTGPSRWCS